MNLADMGIEMGELSVWRRIQAYPATPCCDEQHRGLLELQAPLHVAGMSTRGDLTDLRSLLLECSRRLKGSERDRETHGVFKIREVLPLPADRLHAATTAQLILQTDRYIRSLCFGTGELGLPLDETEIEIDDKPTLQVEFESWMVFDTTARVPNGVIDLSISYPDRWNNGRRPIDEIDIFLAALLAEYRGAHNTNPNFMDSAEMRHWVRDPELKLLEYKCSVVFKGWEYSPIGGGFDFNQSWLQLVQVKERDDMSRYLHPVLEEFRRQLVERVPSLCS